jgi:hypothetical protein
MEEEDPLSILIIRYTHIPEPIDLAHQDNLMFAVEREGKHDIVSRS